MLTIDPKETPIKDLHQYLVGAVAPRPIAFVSTLDEEGHPNLAPYSFFNVFSSNPPTLVFSSNRRVKDNTTKDTLANVRQTGELVVNVVSYQIVRQMAVASIQYPTGVSEFKKSGLTPIPSDLVKPFRVEESPVHMECKVKDIIELGKAGGAGHLIICDILRMHISDSVLDDKGRISPHKIDLMGRLGRAYYVRASGEAIHAILQPVDRLGIGYDQLPQSILNSEVLTGNNLGTLSGLPNPPNELDILNLKKDPYIQALLKSPTPLEDLHHYAQRELSKENIELAARIAWLGEYL